MVERWAGSGVVSVKLATPAHEAIYQDVIAALQASMKRHGDIRNIEIIALLGRMVGYCVALCYPDERDLARLTAIENLDATVRQVASTGPDRPGVHQESKP